jgi:hypothetical protein
MAGSNSIGSYFDIGALITKLVKYLIEGIVIAVAAYSIPKKQIRVDEVALIALCGACTFIILDSYAPAMSSAARSGAGFGIGGNLVGFPSPTRLLA